MITLGKTNTLHSKRQAMSFITKEDVVKKLFDEISPKYTDRQGGYTRIIKTGPRRGDAAEMAVISLVELRRVFRFKIYKYMHAVVRALSIMESARIMFFMIFFEE